LRSSRASVPLASLHKLPPTAPAHLPPDPAVWRALLQAAGLEEESLAADPVSQFAEWLATAVDAGLAEPNAMVIATAPPSAAPSGRAVLLKGLDERGFVFFTNLGSRKATELAANPQAAAVFPWFALGRQVIVTGVVEPVSAAESDAYFVTRPRGAQLGAWASRQSAVIADRPALLAALAEVNARFGDGPVPRPPFWGGLRLVHDEVEFWQGRPDRLHDRLRYRRDRTKAGAWVLERLSP